jgi:uncharacterized protein (DUF952 family)
MNSSSVQYVYKIANRAMWENACRLGTFRGSADDLRDGFIHLSAPAQIAGTLAKHFKGQTDLVLIKLETEALGGALKWERSRGGDLFPHLYAGLPTAAARAVEPLDLDADGMPLVPQGLGQC